MTDERSRSRITEPQRLRALSHPTRMAIIEILWMDGTATATRCAELTGESVASCSYHLGMLAKYGFVGPAEGGQGREKPWELLEREQNWSNEGMDTEGELAVEALNDVYIDHMAEQMKTALRRSTREPQRWRRANGACGSVAYLTADETAALAAELLAVVDRYEDRLEHPELRPAGSRPVRLYLARWLARPGESTSESEED